MQLVGPDSRPHGVEALGVGEGLVDERWQQRGGARGGAVGGLALLAPGVEEGADLFGVGGDDLVPQASENQTEQLDVLRYIVGRQNAQGRQTERTGTRLSMERPE